MAVTLRDNAFPKPMKNLALICTFVLFGCTGTKLISDPESEEEISRLTMNRTAALVFDSGATVAAMAVTVRSDSTSFWIPETKLGRSVATATIRQIEVRDPQGREGTLIGAALGGILGLLLQPVVWPALTFPVSEYDGNSSFPNLGNWPQIGPTEEELHRAATFGIGVLAGALAGNFLGNEYRVTYRRDKPRDTIQVPVR